MEDKLLQVSCVSSPHCIECGIELTETIGNICPVCASMVPESQIADERYGFRVQRLKDQPYGKHEEVFSKNLHDMPFEDWDSIVFGNYTGTPEGYLSHKERHIVASTIQWLGTPVGRSFLKECGFERENGSL